MTALIKVGIVGVGYMGSLHLRAFSSTPMAEVVGIYDIDPRRAEDVRKQFNVQVFHSLEELLREVEAVSIATPTEVHFQVAKRAISMGKHLLLEKPITDDVESAQELVTLAKNRGVTLQIGHIERYNPAVQELLSRVKRPYRIESERFSFPINRNLDAGVILDLMIHDVDIVLKIIGDEPKEISGFAWNLYSGKDDLAEVCLDFGGPVAHLKVGWTHPYKHRAMKVWDVDEEGNAILYELDFVDQSLKLYRYPLSPEEFSIKGAHQEHVPIKRKDLITTEVESFLNAIINGEEPLVTGEDGLRALKLTLRIRDVLLKALR